MDLSLPPHSRISGIGIDIWVFLSFFSGVNSGLPTPPPSFIRNTSVLWSSAQCYVAAWMGGKFGGEWKQVSVRPSHSAVYPTLSQRNTVNQLQSNTKQKSCHKKRTGFDAIMST